MKPLFVSLALALVSLPVLAQPGSLSFRNSVAIQRMKFERGTTPFTQKAGQFRAPRKVFGAQSQYASAITRLADGKTIEDVKAEGVHVLRTIGDFVFIAMPLEDAARVAALPVFKFFEFDRKVDHKMCYARQATGVNTIHQGIGLSQAYTGKGVVCGIVDNGFDVNHVNFLDANGEPRVKYFEMVRTNPNATSIDDYFTFKFYNTPAEIKELTTDNAQTYHGTHTMGIMAGGYSGQTKAALLEDAASGVKAVVKEGISNPYYGMAYESDIIAGTAMNMTSMEIAQAVADLAYYQVYANQPVVINLSLGRSSGAHDGSSAECQVFDMLAKEYGARIVVASGNEGEMKLATKKTLTEGDTTMGSFITGAEFADNKNQKHYIRYGGVEIFSMDKKPFKKISVKVWNKQRNRLAKAFSITPTDDNVGRGMYYCSQGYEDVSGGTYDNTFGKYFEGYVGLGWGIDENSKTPYALIDIATLDDTLYNSAHNYIIGFEVEGEDGQRFEAYASEGIYGLENYGIEGWDDGSRNGTISSMATGKSTLCVGSYTTTNGWPQLDGGIYTQLNADNQPDQTTGKVSSFTSYGTLSDGRNLPHVLGPGAYVISSMNRYYLQAAGAAGNEEILTAVAETDNRDPFGWSAGTSMACPAVTGIIALWLEADPTLTMDEIKEIIVLTAKKTDDMVDEDPEQVGAGLIDAYEGLKEVLRRKQGADGIQQVGADENRLVVSAAGHRKVNVFVAGEKSLNMEVFNVSGARVAQAKALGEEGTIDLTGLAKGTYVIRVNGRLSKCVLVQ